MRTRRTRSLITVTLVLFVALVPALAPARPAAAATDSPAAGAAPKIGQGPYGFFDPIIDVEQLVAAHFVTEPDLKKLQEAALKAMVEALGDPYTEYVPTEDVAEFNKQIRGQYVGIGASVTMDNGWITIVSPLEDSPAYHAGIMAGDRIVAIDGVSAVGMSVEKSIELLTGEPGTTTVVTVERAGQRIEKPIVRSRISTRAVAGVQRLHGDGWDFMIDPSARIGYIRISQFTGGAAQEVRDAVRQLQGQGLQGLVLDLRGNPGGLLAAATQIADMFLDHGLIVTTKGRNHEDESVYAVKEGTLPDMPLVVLVNRESASASEVLSGALRDNGRAIILGTRTFGKGSVQNVYPLPSGDGQIKITEQHYYGPSGKNIHRTDTSTDWGVDPSPGFFVPMTDRAYADMLTVRRERDVIRQDNAKAPPPAPFDPARIATDMKDPQLAAAVEAVRTKLAGGEWKPVGSTEEPAQAVEVAELRRMQLVRERILRELQRVENRIDAISSAVPADKAERPTLLPKDAPLDGGRIDVFDKDGKRVATLNITGPDLERWLTDAPVEKPGAKAPAAK